MSAVDPADTRECDGYPGLRVVARIHDEVILEPCSCGDPGDCGELVHV